MFEFNGEQYSLEQLQVVAEKKGYTIEELFKKNPTIKEVNQKPTKVEEVKSPVGGFFSEQAKTDAVVGPVATATAKQQTATNMASPSVDGSLDLQDPNQKPKRYIKFKDGTVVYEDTYMEKAGTKGYPATFDEYAKAFNTTPKEFDSPEIVIKATPSLALLPKMKSAWKTKVYNKEKGVFETSNFNDQLFNQEEEVAVNVFKDLYAGSNIEFEEANKIAFATKDTAKTGEFGESAFGIPGTEAIRMKVKNKKTGEYIYSKPIELEFDNSLKKQYTERNSKIIDEFIDSNKENLNIPGWTREKNKLAIDYAQFKKQNLDPFVRKEEVLASEKFLSNKDLFKEREEYVNLPYIIQSDGTKISGTSRVLKKIIPYQKDVDKEIVRLKKEGFKGDDDEFFKEAQKRVRVNLYENDVNNAIYKANESYINESDDKEKAQALLYTALIPEKNKKADEFNEVSKLTQIAANKIEKASLDKKLILDLYSNRSVDPNKTAKLEKIVKEYGVFTTNNSEVTNDPKFNAKFGLKETDNVPTNFYNLFNAVESAEKANINLLKINSNKSNEIIGSIEDVSTAMNAASKNYELAEKYGANIALGITDIAAGVSVLAGNILTLGQSEAVKKAGIDYTKFSNEIRDSYSRDVSFDDAFSSGENFGKFLGQEVSNQLPIITAMLLSGGFGGAVVGASSTGQKMMDMQYEMATGNAEYSQADIWLKSVGYGLAEYAFAELTTIPILKRAKSNWIGAGKEQVVNNSTKEYFKSKYKDIVYDPILESIGEIGTTATQNILDGKPILENIDHSGFSGYGFGLAFSAVPFFKGLYNSQFSTYESLNEARKLKSEINSLSNKLLNLQAEEQSDSYKRIFDLVKTKTEKLDDIVKKQEDFINNKLTSRGINYLTEIANSKLDLQNKVEAVIKDDNLSKSEKSEIITAAKRELDILNKRKNNALSSGYAIKNETEWEAFKALNQIKAQDYKNQAEEILIAERFGKEVSTIDINAKAYDLYFADIAREENAKAATNLFKDFKSFETVDEAIADLDNYKDLNEVDKTAIIEGLKDGKDGYAIPTGKTKIQVAVIENQVKNQRRYTKVHEVGHEAFWQLISDNSNNTAFYDISNQLLQTLKKTDKKLYDKFIKDGIDDNSGVIIPAEVISRFLEYVSEGKITNVQKAKGISGLFGVMIQKEFSKDYNFDFRGENDMFNFVIGLGKKIKLGQLTVEDIKAAKENQLISRLKKREIAPTASSRQAFSKSSDIESKIEELSDRYYDGEIDDIDYEQQLENLQKKLKVAQKEELAKPQEVKKPKKVEEDIKVDQLGDAINKIIPKGTTKKQYDTETIGKVSEKLVSGRMLDPLIKKIAAGYGIVSDNVYGKSWEDFYDAVKGVQLLKNLQKFNPETNDDFGGFVIGSQFGIRNRVKEALEQFKKENEGGFKEDVETAKGIISEETEVEEGEVKEKILIDPRKSRIVKDKLPEIEESIDIDPATVTTLTFKNVAEKFGGIAGAKIFDIPVKKVSDPTANLTYATKIVDGVPEYSEAGNIQNAFTNPQQAKEFIKLLPEFNIAGNEVEVSETGEIIDVSSSAKGYAIGVPNNLLKLMYDTYIDPRSLSDSKTERSRAITSPKGRSKGLTSQATVYRLKPEFTGTISNEAVTKFQDMLGITEKGKLNKYDREIGQVLKSVAKLYGSEVANIIVRDKINKSDIKTSKPKSQILADVAAGKSSVMFSKNVQPVRLEKVYKKYEEDIKGAKLYHGGEVIGSKNSNVKEENVLTWFWLNDLEGAKAHIEERPNTPVYETSFNDISGDRIVVPDFEYMPYTIMQEAVEKVYYKGYKPTVVIKDRFANRKTIMLSDYFSAPSIMNDPKASDIIKEFLSWSYENNKAYEDAFGIPFTENGKISEGLPVIVVGEVPISKLKEVFRSNKKGEVYFSKGTTISALSELYLDRAITAIDPRTKEGKPLRNIPGTKVKLNKIITRLLFTESYGGYDEFLKAQENLNDIQKQVVDQVFNGRDWMFGLFSSEQVKNNGIMYEKLIKRAIKELKLKDVSVDLSEGGYGSGVDLVLTVRGKNINIELKLNRNAQFGSFGIKGSQGEYTFTGGASGLKEKLPSLEEQIQKELNSKAYQINLKNFIDRALELGGKLDENGMLTGSRKMFETLISEKLLQKLNINIKKDANGDFLDEKLINLIYNNKNVYNIEIGGKGMYYLGENKDNLNIPELKGYTSLMIRQTYNQRGKSGVYSLVNRAFLKLDSNIQESTVNFSDLNSMRDNINTLVSFSKSGLDVEFNKILENKTGIAYDQTISEVKAKMIADSKRNFNFFIPPSAEDFVGLLYYTLGKGETGEKQMQFYKRTLLDPYARANQAISRDRNALGRRFKEIKKEFKVTPKDLKKRTPDGLFTREQAVRVFIWDSIGKEIPGLSEKDIKELVDYVKSDRNLSEFATQVMMLNPGKSYTAPTDTWITGNITTDLLEVLNTSRRAMHLKQWQQNVDAIFSNENLNKLEAAYGTQYREAMKNILKRMKTGRNRTYGTDTLTGRFADWINGSVGAIMFFNTRTVVLQTISAVNFINFTDNNVLAAGKAFANQKQYWTDFTTLFKSEYLIDRRDGLKVNVNEADIAEIAKEKGVRGALNYLLKLGFTPTQIADSFAIASGGATFYRNRIKSLVKKGMDPVAAEKLAMRDFIETAEESQQSSRPDKISQQQAGPLGRIVLAFANTPAQYARLIKKAASDLKNGRGDAKTNISKILYYGAVQNIIFNALQQALFAMTFGDEEEEDKKTVDIINGMIDGIARGTGLGGAVFTVVKNTALKLYRDSEKKNPKYEDGFLEVLKISPPISSKIQKLRAAGRTMSWDMDEIKEKGASLESPAVMAGAKVTSAMFNFPADRVVQKIENLVDASDSELETYKRLALVGGWSAWELGIKEEEKKKEVKSNSTRKRSSVKKSVLRKTIIR